jgi:hypothetical protein
MGDKLHIISGSGRIAVHVVVERMSDASPHALDNVAPHEVVCIMCMPCVLIHALKGI